MIIMLKMTLTDMSWELSLWVITITMMGMPRNSSDFNLIEYVLGQFGDCSQ